MRIPKSIRLLTATALTAMLLTVSTAQAYPYEHPTVSVHTLNGINGNVAIGEFEIDGITEIGEAELFASGGYFVDVLNEEYSVFGFAVSINSHVYPYTFREGWNEAFISQSEWDAGHEIGIEGLGGLLTTDIGSFGSLFGDDEYVNLYYNVEGDGITDSSDSDQLFPTDPELAEFFFVGGFLASEFVAFTPGGTIIDQSLQSNQPIPEPSTLFLFGTGIVGLVAHTVRKKFVPTA